MSTTLTLETTVTLETEVVDALRAEAAASGRSVDQVISDSVRRCCKPQRHVSEQGRFRVKPLPVVFKPGIDWENFNRLNDELAHEEALQKLPQ